MAVHRQWALPFTVDAQDLQRPDVTGHVGGARGVHTQTLRGGAALHAAVSDVIDVFFREENKAGEKVMVIIHYLHKGIQYILCTHLCLWEELYFDILSDFYLWIMHFPCSPWGGSRVKGSS